MQEARFILAMKRWSLLKAPSLRSLAHPKDVQHLSATNSTVTSIAITAANLLLLLLISQQVTAALQAVLATLPLRLLFICTSLVGYYVGMQTPKDGLRRTLLVFF
jgi:hypothetical protein